MITAPFEAAPPAQATVHALDAEHRTLAVYAPRTTRREPCNARAPGADAAEAARACFVVVAGTHPGASALRVRVDREYARPSGKLARWS